MHEDRTRVAGAGALDYVRGVDGGLAVSLLPVAEADAAGLRGLDRKPVFERFERNRERYLAAIDLFLESGSADEAARLATVIAPLWIATGRLDEGAEWLERVLEADASGAVRKQLCIDAAFLHFWRGDDGRAAMLFEEAANIARQTDDAATEALALTGSARIALRTDVEAARRLCLAALELADPVAAPLARGSAVHVLGVAAQMAGDLEEAASYMNERLALARASGNYAAVASEAGNLAIVERQLGNLDAAETLSLEALDISVRREDDWLIPYLLSGLAAIAVERGELCRSATLIGAAEAMVEEQNAEWPPDERVHYDATRARLEASMSGADLAAAREEGRQFDRARATRFALG